MGPIQRYDDAVFNVRGILLIRAKFAGGGYPHPGWFLAKSAETIENKGVVFFVSAKKRKRVRKSLKRKRIGWKHGEILASPSVYTLRVSVGRGGVHPPSREKECITD